ncbi:MULTISPECIES: PIG-L deacetylase family protein [unclassified Brachybacterium]|uniref:PIG-L deacetylase family protein n=1 Tax=unclassified Brachybacterium TaxID=2623841 RepID=UPI000C81007E|nr:PIG-L family deacetylase [Brachybacterium sp. UMB0905]PMC75972.1 LmbE family protein [Brachybacterium sp. UMB0905]
MRARTILAVGGHIGDMDLAAGPLLAQNVLDGGRSVLVALTAGERGHPRLGQQEYRAQKIAEAQEFARGIGAEFHLVGEVADGELTDVEQAARELVPLLREIRPELLIAHWPRSIHTDHTCASHAAQRARLLSGLPGFAPELGERHGIAELLFTENWEDAEGFTPTCAAEISEDAFQAWSAAISGQAFARGETYGFRYIDYYTAQMTLRGCLAGLPRAVALAADPTPMLETLP